MVTEQQSTQADDFQTGNQILQRMFHVMNRALQPNNLNSYSMRPSDIIITAFPKSGNALLQQMCYQIAVLSGGYCEKDESGLDFDDLMIVAPWIEQMHRLNTPPWESSPRIFKTHMSLSLFQPLRCKHIIIIRNPMDIPASMLNFLFNMLAKDTMISDKFREYCVNKVMSDFVLGKKCSFIGDNMSNWHSTLKSATDCLRKDVLILFYENVVDDLKKTIRIVASFMQCRLTNDEMDVVCERCDREYMANDDKFQGYLEERCFGTPGNAIHTQSQSLIGFKKFPIQSELLDQLKQLNLSIFGVATYEEIMSQVMTSQRRLHEHHFNA